MNFPVRKLLVESLLRECGGDPRKPLFESLWTFWGCGGSKGGAKIITQTHRSEWDASDDTPFTSVQIYDQCTASLQAHNDVLLVRLHPRRAPHPLAHSISGNGRWI